MTRKVCVFDDSETIQNKDILSSDFGSGSETESMMDSEVELNNKHINTQNSFGILKNRKVMEIINDDATTAVDSGLGSEEEEKNLNDDFNQDVCTYDVLYISYDMVKHM